MDLPQPHLHPLRPHVGERIARDFSADQVEEYLYTTYNRELIESVLDPDY